MSTTDYRFIAMPRAGLRVLALVLLAATALPHPIAGQSAEVISQFLISAHYGQMPDALASAADFGRAVANIGDLDGDGVDDLAVGAPGIAPGSVYLLYLNRDGTVKDHRRITAGESGFNPAPEHLQPDADDPLGRVSFGSAVAAIGDLDGNGVTELAVGALEENHDDFNDADGALYILFLDADGTVTDYQRIQETIGLGLDVSAVGDVNGDGIPDVGVAHEEEIFGSKAQPGIFFLDKDGAVIGEQFFGNGIYSGTAIAAVGDLDGDGVSEIAAGAARDGLVKSCGFFGCTGSGLVYLYFMNADGTIRSEQRIGEGTGGFTGIIANNDAFGHALAPMGDADGDGIADLLVGSQENDGAVWLLMLNKDGTVKANTLYQYPAIFNETLEHALGLGTAVAPLGDLDGDGTLDFAAGAPGPGSGEVNLFFLNPDHSVAQRRRLHEKELPGLNDVPIFPLLDIEDNDFFGESAVNLGDVNGDGVDDVAVGGHGGDDAGAVWVILLRDDGTPMAAHRIDDQDKILEAELDAGDDFGRALAAPGDLNGDGIPDLIVGAPDDDDGATDAGAIYLLFLDDDGAVDDVQKISAREGGFKGDLNSDDAFGTGLAFLGDRDGDGLNEIAVGAAHTGALEGALWILTLAKDNRSVERHLRIDDKEANLTVEINAGDKFGWALAAVGDVNGDGMDDLAVGAPSVGIVEQGAVHLLFFEKDGTVQKHVTIAEGEGGFPDGLGDFANFGSSLTTLDDLNRDGHPELVVGADGQDRRGAAWILSLEKDGNVTSAQRLSDGLLGFRGAGRIGDGLGSAVAGLGDLNDDGTPDLLIGAATRDEYGANRGAVWTLMLEDPNTANTETLTVLAEGPDGNALAVPITLAPVDLDGNALGSTPMTLRYPENTAVFLNAPEVFEALVFDHWRFENQSGRSDNDITIAFEDGETATAVYSVSTEMRTLTVEDVLGGGDVPIAVTPADTSGNTDGATTFERTYPLYTTVTLTAPEAADGRVFKHWTVTIDLYVEVIETRTISVEILYDYTVKAHYEAATEQYTLTVGSELPDAGVEVVVSPADANGAAGGTTAFTRTYLAATTVTLTAPDSAGGNAFAHWRLGDVVASDGRTLEVTVTEDASATAVFSLEEEEEEGGCPWVATPTNASGVFLGRATVEGTPASGNDCIAALDADGNIAGVNNILFGEGIAYITLALYGDDAATNVDEGLTPGEAFTLHLYDASDDAVLVHNATFTCWEATNGAPISGCGDVSTTYDFTAAPAAAQTIALAQGWNLITPTLETGGPTPADFFGTLEGGTVLAVTSSDCDAGSLFYDPAVPDFLNTLGAVVPGQGYWVKADSAATLTHQGDPLPSDFSRDLCAGWNTIGYWPAQAAVLTDAFAEVIASGAVEVVTGFDPEAGAVFYDAALPDFLNTLTTLEPGRGYWVRLGQAVEGFRYAASAGKQGRPQATAPPPSLPVGVQATNAFMFVHGQVSDGGGTIEILTPEGRVVGAAAIHRDGTFAAAVYGDDPTTEATDGARTGALLHLRHGAQRYETDLRFTPDMGMREVRLADDPTLPTDYALDQNYPNPFNPRTLIRFGLPAASAVRLVVFDALGRRVAVLVDEAREAGWHEVSFEAGRLSSGLYLYHLEAGAFRQTGRMMLVK